MGNASGTIESMVDSAATAANSIITKVGQASGFSATKVWHLKLGGEGYVITLRHELSGERRTYVNGKLVHQVVGSSRDLNINFKGHNRVTVSVHFNEDDSSYSYALTLNGKLAPEFSQLTSLECQPLVVNVVSGQLRTIQGQAVVMYKIESSRPGEEGITVERRFSDFANLDRLLRSSFYGNHLLSSMPALPPKGNKYVSDQTKPEFIASRRESLDIYIKKMLQMPRIPIHPDFLDFLGRPILEPFDGVEGPFLAPMPPMVASAHGAPHRRVAAHTDTVDPTGMVIQSAPTAPPSHGHGMTSSATHARAAPAAAAPVSASAPAPSAPSAASFGLFGDADGDRASGSGSGAMEADL